MAPALFACVAANEAEKATPAVIINDVQMMGVSGRVFIKKGNLNSEYISQNSSNSFSDIARNVSVMKKIYSIP